MSALAANPSIRYEADMFRETGRSGRRPLGFRQICWRFLHAVRLTKRTSGLTHALTCCAALLVVNLVLIPATSATVEGASVSMVDAATISILNDQDVSRYQRIFDLQEGGDWKAADKVIAKLEDRILMGHLLYQRYMHPTKYRSKFKELSSWMKKYAISRHFPSRIVNIHGGKWTCASGPKPKNKKIVHNFYVRTRPEPKPSGIRVVPGGHVQSYTI